MTARAPAAELPGLPGHLFRVAMSGQLIAVSCSCAAGPVAVRPAWTAAEALAVLGEWHGMTAPLHRGDNPVSTRRGRR